jgi:hypothetical protein
MSERPGFSSQRRLRLLLSNSRLKYPGSILSFASGVEGISAPLIGCP